MKALAACMLVVVSCFAGLTLFPALASEISREIPMSRSDVFVVSAMYAAGVFASYLVGCVPSVSSSARRVVAMATAVVSSSMFATSVASNVFEVASLRFLQGFASMVVPVFSTWLAQVYANRLPIALGILFAGTFIGGAVGYLATPVSMVLGWRATYALYAVLVLVSGTVWFRTCPQNLTVPRVSMARAARLWRDPFTLLWGSSFFTAMWILFTVATLGQQLAPTNFSRIFGEALQISMALWSVAGGVLAYALSRRRAFVASVGRVQQMCLTLAALGALLSMRASSAWEAMIAAALLGAVQGASPAFWSLPGTSYPGEEAALAGFVLGALSNAAALVGPLVDSFVAVSMGTAALWASLSAISLSGIALTSMAMRAAPPMLLASNRGGRAAR